MQIAPSDLWRQTVFVPSSLPVSLSLWRQIIFLSVWRGPRRSAIKFKSTFGKVLPLNYFFTQPRMPKINLEPYTTMAGGFGVPCEL